MFINCQIPDKHWIVKTRHALETYHRDILVGSCVVLQFSQANFTRRLRDIFNPQTSSVTLQSGMVVLSSHKHRGFHTKFSLQNSKCYELYLQSVYRLWIYNIHSFLVNLYYSASWLFYLLNCIFLTPFYEVTESVIQAYKSGFYMKQCWSYS